MTDLNRALLVASPMTKPCHVPGSVIMRGNCGHDVWISPASMTMLKTNPMGVDEFVIKCSDCAIAEASELADANFREVPGQREELANWSGEERIAAPRPDQSLIDWALGEPGD